MFAAVVHSIVASNTDDLFNTRILPPIKMSSRLPGGCNLSFMGACTTYSRKLSFQICISRPGVHLYLLHPLAMFARQDVGGLCER